MSEGDERIVALQEGVSSNNPFLVVVAGPNGAGKSTFVECFLKPTSIRIVNPDDIARVRDASMAQNARAYYEADLTLFASSPTASILGDLTFYYGFARSRSNCRRVTVHVRGTDCGVKHILSSHAW